MLCSICAVHVPQPIHRSTIRTVMCICVCTFIIGNPLYLCHSGNTPIIVRIPGTNIPAQAIAAPPSAAAAPNLRSARAPQKAAKLKFGPVHVYVYVCFVMIHTQP
jgi:hypothetical protein